MKIKNEFAQLIKNGAKTIEIRKLKSLCKIFDNPSVIFNGGILKINMGISDYQSPNCLKIFSLIFNGYQKIKVSDLLNMIEPFKNYSKEELEGYDRWECDFSDIDEWYQTPIWLRDNLDWILEWKGTGEWYDDEYQITEVSHKNYDFICDYLKNEKYCIIYFIDYENTKEVNSW